jgi:DNA-directed RNA polymerase specialized sigma24 family protein
LRVHRRRLRFEDLEDCYSQATLELVLRARRSPFADADHVRNALEQKFLSRINDRRRALGGRSGIEAAIANALPVEGSDDGLFEIEDRGAVVERQVAVHAEVRRLREVITELTLDQRLVLHGQVNLELAADEFCARYGWSIEKFRKVSQRARWRLRALVDEYQSGERCRRLEADLVALVARTADVEQTLRARAHVANCASCAHYVVALERAQRRVAAALPPLLGPGVAGVLLAQLKRVLLALRHPGAEVGGTGAAGVTGASTAGLAAVKASVAALSVATAAGGYAFCEHVAVPFGLGGRVHQVASHRHYNPARAEVPSTVSSAMRLVVVQPSPASRERSEVAQVRREFGVHHAAAASVPSPPVSPLPAQSPATTRQEQTEFGFER